MLFVGRTRGLCLYGSAEFITLAYPSNLSTRRRLSSPSIALSGGVIGLATYDTYEEEKRSTHDHLEDLGVDGRIILRWILKKSVGRVWTWIDLVQDRDKWRPVVNAVMNLRVS
jgi:hypothetical protein